ncbi:MAG TPA: hypothetical protein VF510_02545 [Ktedonobacterales bacterium]
MHDPFSFPFPPTTGRSLSVLRVMSAMTNGSSSRPNLKLMTSAAMQRTSALSAMFNAVRWLARTDAPCPATLRRAWCSSSANVNRRRAAPQCTAPSALSI